MRHGPREANFLSTMPLRHATAALLFLVLAAFGPEARAIDENTVVEPRGANAPAAEAAPQADALGGLYSSGASSIGMFVTILGYVIILGGLGVVLWFLVKRGVIRQPFAKGEGKLRIAETRMLGNRQFIMVVEYEDQKILLGVGPGKIDYLTNLQSHGVDFSQAEALQRRIQGGEA